MDPGMPHIDTAVWRIYKEMGIYDEAPQLLQTILLYNIISSKQSLSRPGSRNMDPPR